LRESVYTPFFTICNRVIATTEKTSLINEKVQIMQSQQKQPEKRARRQAPQCQKTLFETPKNDQSKGML
jgi:hypothetical protein